MVSSKWSLEAPSPTALLSQVQGKSRDWSQVPAALTLFRRGRSMTPSHSPSVPGMSFLAAWR